MRAIATIFLLVCMGAWAGVSVRNPFYPPPDPCAGEPPQWQFRGMITGPAGALALVIDGDGRWRRLAKDAPLSGGWQVAAISPRHMVLHRGDHCPALIVGRK